jgi:signal transduction histidine kinase
MALPWLRRLTAPLDALLAMGLVAGAVIESLGNDTAPHPEVRAALSAIAVSSVAVRRTFPTFAAVLFAAAMAIETWTTESPDEMAVLFAFLFVSYSVAAYAPRREAFLGGAILTLALAHTIAADPSDSVSNILPSVLLFVAVPFGLGLAMRRRQLDIAVLTLETETLADEADAAVDAERRRLARELHDVVSHAVTLIAVQAEAGQSVIDSDPEAARRSLAAIGQVSREALAELARLLAILGESDDAAPEAGLTQISSLVDGARAAGLDVTLRESGDRHELGAETDHCAYRVVQEGLTNALRHSSDARVRISVNHEPGRLRIVVSSSGTPHASSYGGAGRGLSGLRERVLLLGGDFEARAHGANSFEIQVELPTRSVEPAGRG